MADNQDQERDKLITEWMRSNEVFKSLARCYGKGGKPAKLGQSDTEEARPKTREGCLDAREEALLDWLARDEAFKTLSKQYGRSFPRPKPKN